jgi:hypothetical protein
MPHLPRPVIPRIPFRADPEVIERTHTRRWGT